MEQWDHVVVGAGIAGVSAARVIVDQNAQHRVLLVNGEEGFPYKRTRLSKRIAEGFSPNDAYLEDPAWYSEHGVEIRNSSRATEIDAGGRIVRLSDQSEHRYGSLLLATGAKPVYPPTFARKEEAGVYTLRSVADLTAIRAAAVDARRILVDGMGVLAVEVAEQLCAMGKRVTVAGAAAQLMPRNLNDRAAEILEHLLLDRGVKLRYREEMLAIEKRSKGGFSVSTIREAAAFDMVIVCIGVLPDLDLAQDAGAAVGRGVLVDRHQRTSMPGIYAAGDVAEDEEGRVTQLWHAAEYQGRIAALNMVGQKEEGDLLPFRMKCEVFDTYFFSMAKPENLVDVEIDERESADHYRCFYYSAGRLGGAVMVHDKARARLYEQAVRERWDRDRVETEFDRRSPPRGED